MQPYGPSSGFRHSEILRSPVVALMWRLLWAAHSVEMNHAPGGGRIPAACSCFLADTHSHWFRSHRRRRGKERAGLINTAGNISNIIVFPDTCTAPTRRVSQISDHLTLQPGSWLIFFYWIEFLRDTSVSVPCHTCYLQQVGGWHYGLYPSFNPRVDMIFILYERKFLRAS